MQTFLHILSEVAELFFIDTTPFVDKYFRKPRRHHYDWRGVMPRQHYISNLLKVLIAIILILYNVCKTHCFSVLNMVPYHLRQQNLETALQNSTANWKIVVGHHTIRSIGHHGETKELVKTLLPILEVVSLVRERSLQLKHSS